MAFLRRGTAAAMLDDGVVVVGHQVEYRRSIEYRDEPVTIELGVSRLGGARIEFAYRIEQAGEVAVVARSVLCPFDFDAQLPARLAADDRSFFDGYRIEEEPLRELAAPHLEGRGTEVPLWVRWTDVDSFGHVNNVAFYDFFQQARVTATTAWDPTMARAGAQGSEHLWLVARQDADYLAQLPHRIEPYATRVAPVRLGSTSLTLAAEVVDPRDGTVYARGHTVLVCADADGRATRLPEVTRQRLTQHLVEG